MIIEKSFYETTIVDGTNSLDKALDVSGHFSVAGRSNIHSYYFHESKKFYGRDDLVGWMFYLAFGIFYSKHPEVPDNTKACYRIDASHTEKKGSFTFLPYSGCPDFQINVDKILWSHDDKADLQMDIDFLTFLSQLKPEDLEVYHFLSISNRNKKGAVKTILRRSNRVAARLLKEISDGKFYYNACEYSNLD